MTDHLARPPIGTCFHLHIARVTPAVFLGLSEVLLFTIFPVFALTVASR